MQAGFAVSATRFGLHSHGQYIDFKQSVVYSTADPNNEVAVSHNNVACDFTGIIPANILNLKASDLLDIMGFSSYPLPQTPVDPSSTASQMATFGRLQTTLGLMDQVAQRYGKFTTGPYTGQYVKQGLAVEYASTFHYPDQTGYQQQHTTLFFQILQAYPWFLGPCGGNPPMSTTTMKVVRPACTISLAQMMKLPLQP